MSDDEETVTADETAMVLDVLNSTPVLNGRAEDVFADDAAAASWLDAHGMPSGAEHVRALRTVRDRLQAVARGDASPETLNPHVSGVSRLPELDRDGLHWRLTGAATAPARLVLAWARIAHESPGRLRPCANGDCRLFLLDRTRANTARWCSMDTCGNLMKARRHRARATEG